LYDFRVIPVLAQLLDSGKSHCEQSMFRAPISRVFLRGAMTAALAFLAPYAAVANGAAAKATVQQVAVRQTAAGVEVEIQTSVPVAPDTQAITGPDRIVVDFPGATPSAALRVLKVNQGALKSVRSGLFFSNPPITRIVLDLTGPQNYQISSAGNSTIVKLARAGAPEASPSAATGRSARFMDAALASRSAHLLQANLAPAPLSPAKLAPASAATSASGRIISSAPVASVASDPTSQAPPQVAMLQPSVPAQPAVPPLSVIYENGMLSIHADKATLSQVLYEVHLRTQAEIAIPAGAEQEQVMAELGPAPACDVLSQLLNGSAYNFIFVGDEGALQRVILTRKEGSC
jgi:AMIN domain